MNPHTELKALTGWEYDAGDRYSTDFLLGKLPKQTKLFKARENTYGAYIGGSIQEKYKSFGDTPSEALCKLAITLKKEGVI